MQLQVDVIQSEDAWRDIVRINRAHRRDVHGKHIPRGSICRIFLGDKSKWVIAHGREAVDPVIQMDQNARLALGANLHSSYEFKLERIGWLRSLWFPWMASDPIYRLPAQLSVVSLVVGIILGVLGILASLH